MLGNKHSSLFERLPSSLKDEILEFLSSECGARTKVLSKSCKTLSCRFESSHIPKTSEFINARVSQGDVLSSLIVGPSRQFCDIAASTKKLRTLTLLKFETIVDVDQAVPSLRKLTTTCLSPCSWTHVALVFVNLVELSVCIGAQMSRVDLTELNKLTTVTLSENPHAGPKQTDVLLPASVTALSLLSGMRLVDTDTSRVRTLVLRESFAVDRPLLNLTASLWPALSELRVKAWGSPCVDAWLKPEQFRLKTFEFESYDWTAKPKPCLDLRHVEEAIQLRLTGQQLPELPVSLRVLNIWSSDRHTTKALQRALQTGALNHLEHIVVLTLGKQNDDNDTLCLDLDLLSCQGLRHLTLTNITLSWTKVCFSRLERLEFDQVRGIDWRTFQCFRDQNLRELRLVQTWGANKVLSRLPSFTRLERVNFTGFHTSAYKLAFKHGEHSHLVPPTCVVRC